MSQESRARFNESLRTLEADAARMGSLVMEMVSVATRIALEDMDSLAPKVIAWESEVDGMERDIVQRVIVMIATEAPVADNLLFLSATLYLVLELEQIGDEASKLASRLIKLQGEFPFEMNELLREISTESLNNLRDSLRLYSQYTREAANTVIQNDDVVDRTFKASRNQLIKMIRERPEDARQFLRCLEVFHALEHVSDRASDIAKRMRTCYEPFVKIL